LSGRNGGTNETLDGYMFEGRAKVHAGGKTIKALFSNPYSNKKFTTVPSIAKDQIPTVDYKVESYRELEERIKMELKSIGLICEDLGKEGRQDDEVCAEIRCLQRKLKEQA